MKKLILILTLFLLTSCSYNEPNDIAYVVAMGFDKATDNTYDITVQFAKPAQISGGSSEEGGKGGDIVENLTVEAPNLYSAINIANNIISKKFTLSHLKLVVFSKDIAEVGIMDTVDTMIRSEELRPDVYLAVAEDKAKEYLTGIKPIIEVNPAKYYHLIYEKNDSGGVPKSSLQQFYFEDKTHAECSVLPLAGTIKSEENEQENEKNEEAKMNDRSFEYKLKNYRGGQVAIQNKNKGEAMGMAVFKNGKMIADLGGIEGELYNMLTGHLKKSFISFENSLSDKPITLRLDQMRRPKYNIDVSERKIEISVFMESDIYSLPVEYTKAEQIDEFEKEARQSINKNCEEFIKYCRDELDVDIINLSNVAKRNFWTLKGYNDFNFRSHFKEFDITVNTDLKIRRSGMKLLEK